ncbi:MAG: AraC family transcriptional regulator [Verrucomicrobiota bacterium]|nr:AraC family transcriptional regulator [Verrucomicrobiota bacterium]
MIYHLKFRKNVFAQEGLHIHQIYQTELGIHGMHDQDFYEFTLVINGKALHHINGQTQNLSEGSLLLVRPGDTHTMSVIGRPPLYMWNVAVDPKLWKKMAATHLSKAESLILTGKRLTPLAQLDPFRTKQLHQSIVHLSRIEGKRLHFMHLLSEVLLHVLDKWKADDLRRIPTHFQKACAVLETVEGLKNGVPAMTQASGLTREHFSRELKRLTGKTPTDLLIEARLAKACSLLLTSQAKIIDVAYDSGFNHLGYFSRTFTRIYGVSPGRWRQLKRDETYLTLKRGSARDSSLP